MLSKEDISVKTFLLLAAVATVVAGLAGTAMAQADPQVPYPFFYLIKAKVDATKVNAYQEALAKVVEAHKQHDSGNNWAAFSQLFGGP